MSVPRVGSPGDAPTWRGPGNGHGVAGAPGNHCGCPVPGGRVRGPITSQVSGGRQWGSVCVCPQSWLLPPSRGTGPPTREPRSGAASLATSPRPHIHVSTSRRDNFSWVSTPGLCPHPVITGMALGATLGARRRPVPRPRAPCLPPARPWQGCCRRWWGPRRRRGPSPGCAAQRSRFSSCWWLKKAAPTRTGGSCGTSRRWRTS